MYNNPTFTLLVLHLVQPDACYDSRPDILRSVPQNVMRIIKLIGEKSIVSVVDIQVLGFLRQYNDTLGNEADIGKVPGGKAIEQA